MLLCAFGPYQFNVLHKSVIIHFLLTIFQVRHGPGFYNCTLTMQTNEDGQETGEVHLPQDDQGLAAGQFAAFYDGNTCIGSGVILESWDDTGFPVCSKALERARLVDKTKLGKPVKIMFKPESYTEETDQRDKTKFASTLGTVQ